MTSRRCSFGLPSVAVVAGALFMQAHAQADTVVMLPDPTRPPNSVKWSSPSSGASGAPGLAAPAAASGASSAATAKAAASSPRRLLSIRTTGEGEGMALIDGQLVSVGDRVGNATVVSMDSDTVVLRGAQGLQKLSLMPTVNKTAPGAESAAGRGAKER